jgi:hypothetical protein
MNLVIVLGYGNDLDSPLRPYLDGVAEFIEDNFVSQAIFSGGESQRKSHPGQTEARTMWNYVASRLTCPGDVNVNLDHRPLTTFENIRNAARIIQGQQLEPDNIFIFCEATRALKVAILTRWFFGFRVTHYGRNAIKIQTSSWELMHPLKELVGTLKDTACLFVPGLWRYFRWQRERRAARI